MGVCLLRVLFVLSGRGLCDELMTRSEESYRLCCVVCDLESSIMRRTWPTGGGTVAPIEKEIDGSKNLDHLLG